MPRTPISNDLSVDLQQGTGTLSQRLATSILNSIAEGALREQQFLPSTRSLADQLGISRSVVVATYDELAASGFLIARPGASTIVAPGASHAAAADARTQGPLGSTSHDPAFAKSVAPHIARRPRRASPIRFDLLPGYPDPQLIDRRDWRRAARIAAESAISTPTVEVAVPDLHRIHGLFPTLQELIAGHVRVRRNIVCDPDDIFFFSSVSAALSTLARALQLKGKTVGAEDPGYARARDAFTRAGATVHSLPVDRDGLRTEQLNDSSAAVYVTPAHQFPTGARLSVVRRAELLDWAHTHDTYVFEDDYDGEFRYDVAPMPALRSMKAGVEHVVYLGTASKALTRDLRVAWAITPPHLRATIQRSLVDEGDSVSALSALTLAEFLRSGAMTRHIVRAMRTYQARRHRFTNAIEQHLPDVTLLGVNAGLHTVLALDGLDERAAVEALAAQGLACTSLDHYTSPSLPPSDRLRGLVCGYSQLAETQAMDAARIIATTVISKRS